VRVGAVLEHTETVLPVLARIEVVVLQPVHLSIPLCTTGADSTDKGAGTLLSFFD
jgi:hypothetical protein